LRSGHGFHASPAGLLIIYRTEDKIIFDTLQLDAGGSFSIKH
jgi:hypothetical protein